MTGNNQPFTGLRQDRLLVARLVDGALFASQATIAAICILLVSKGDIPVPVFLLAATMAAITLLRWLLMRRTNLHGYRNTYDAGLRLRSDILEKLIRLPLGTFQAMNPGRIVQAFGEDVLWLENEASSTRPDIAFNAAAMAVLLASALAISPFVTVMAILFLGGGLLLLRLTAKRVEQGFERRAHGLEHAAFSMSEFCEGMAVLRAFSAARQSSPDFERQVERLRQGARKGVLFATPLAVTFRGLVDLAVALSIGLSMVVFAGHGGDPGRFAASSLLLAASVIPARNLAALSAMLTLARIARSNIKASSKTLKWSMASMPHPLMMAVSFSAMFPFAIRDKSVRR